MISIDERLRHAESVAVTWSSRHAREFAETLAYRAGAHVDWDEGAGEGWLRIVDGPQVVAIVSIAIPLVIAQRIADNLDDSNADITVLVVDDLDEAVLSCSLAVLGQVFGAPDRFGVLDPERFSANELWYSTV